jgi:hypothetical protein
MKRLFLGAIVATSLIVAGATTSVAAESKAPTEARTSPAASASATFNQVATPYRGYRGYRGYNRGYYRGYRGYNRGYRGYRGYNRGYRGYNYRGYRGYGRPGAGFYFRFG